MLPDMLWRSKEADDQYIGVYQQKNNERPGWGSGRIIFTILMVAAALVFGARMAYSQNQQAATEIAKNGDPAKYTDPLDCMERTARLGATFKEAKDVCLKFHAMNSSTIKKVNNESADATKNNFPKPPGIMPGYGGYGYGGGYYNSGLAGMNAPGFVPGGGPGGVNITYNSNSCGNGGCNRRY